MDAQSQGQDREGRTVSVARSKEQYAALRQAIKNWCQLQTTLQQMQVLSCQLILGNLPDTRRRKRLTKKILGAN